MAKRPSNVIRPSRPFARIVPAALKSFRHPLCFLRKTNIKILCAVVYESYVPTMPTTAVPAPHIDPAYFVYSEVMYFLCKKILLAVVTPYPRSPG